MKIYSLLASSILLFLLMADARCQVSVPGLEWQHSHAPAGMSLENRASALLTDGSVAVLGKQRPISFGSDKSGDQGWIGVFAPSGDLKQEWSFVLRASDTALQDVDGFVPVVDGGFIVAGVRPDGESVLVSVDVHGTVMPMRSLGRKRAAFLLRLHGGDLVLGGRDRRDLYASRLRTDGAVVWERELDRGFDELFLDGVARNDDVVMLEHSGIREQFFMRDAKVGLTVVSAGSDSIKLPKFTRIGRAGALVAAGAGYGMLIDTGAGVQQKLEFVHLDPAFTPISTTEILATPFSLERARLARRSDAGYQIATLFNTRLVWLRLDPAGMLVGRIDSPAGRVFMHPDVLAGKDTYGIATELKEIPGAIGLRKVIYMVKFSPR